MVKNLVSKKGFISFFSSLFAILVGLIVGLIILLISNPSHAFKGFFTILIGGLSDMKNIGQVLYYATPLIMTGLSVGFGKKTGLFNIGASGQFIIGAFAAVFIGIKITNLPGYIHLPLCLIAAMVFGAIWGFVPGILKAKANVNEVISCIMMNYIGMYLVNFLVKEYIFDSLKNQSQRIADTATLPQFGLDKIFNTGNSASSVTIGIFLCILIAILLYILLNKTTFGFELKACGLNKYASQYAGINENRNIVLSMMISGALAGIGGAFLYLAGTGKGIEVVDVLAPEGFQGIPVALLGMNNPIGIIFSGLLISYLKVGGFMMQLHNFSPEVIDIIIAIIIYFSAFSLLVKLFLTKKFSSDDKDIYNKNSLKKKEVKQ
ncbi:MAG: ABC transporter permease [Miniphocaeibacter sp.]|uniref:ABC transporter permease n=1 Tax=Miniphocaeibacter sp. TaxID=3100973 RepID=UPI0017FD53FF|nr:ABC transporter permease [Gallicola sp.]